MNKYFSQERSRPKIEFEDKLTFGKRIENARLACGLSRPKLAERMGITLGGVSSWEYGRTRPDLNTLGRLCEVLHVSSDSLLGLPTAREDLSAEEKAFLQEYRRLPANEKHYIEGMVKMMNEAADSGESAQKDTDVSRLKIIRLPLNPLSMCAGDGELLFDGGETEYIDLIDCDILAQCDELVKVSGSSMEPEFYDGDLALVKHASTLNEGEIGVFSVDGEGMIKQYKKDGLYPLNKKYSVIHPDPFASFRCFGKVIGKVTEDMLPKRAQARSAGIALR